MLDGSDKRFANLKLPKRFESLEEEAKKHDAELTRIVQRVDDAASRVETLLRQVRDGGIGRFELFLGHSGAGKTTFFKTLPLFFRGSDVTPIPKEIPLAKVADYVRDHSFGKGERQVWVLYDRDNPQTTVEEAFEFFETLRVLFREQAGKVVIFWPITEPSKARMLSEQAWLVGRDSVVDLNHGIYEFVGPRREDYVSIAELTVRSLVGQSLEVFGLTSEVVMPLVRDSETISEFFARVEAKSAEINGYYRDLLQNRAIPSVWILVAGDDSRDLNLTVATLTQGTQKEIDIDRIVKYLDDPELDAAYLKEWKKRRNEVAFLFRLLNVRIFELPPNVALAAIRGYGEEDVKKSLKLQSSTPTNATDTLSKAAFIKALTGEEYGRVAYLTATDQQTSFEYRRLQAKARTDDKKFNKALAAAISDTLGKAGITADVSAEKQVPDGNLKPDIRVLLSDGRIVCLEPTWRSTGKEIPGELDSRQNTLTVGHIQKYLFEKVLGYVNDLGM